MKKIILNVVIVLYILSAIFVTTCLLSYNNYNVSEIENKTLILIKSDFDIFKKGDLVIANKISNEKYTIGDKVFYYNTYEKIVGIDYSFIKSKEKITDAETTFLLDKDYYISSEYVISNVQNSKIIHNLGGILSVLESRWGFLFIFVFPILFVFIYEVYRIKKEVKK